MKSSTYVALSISAAFIVGVLPTASFVGQMALGVNNCDPDFTVCSGGTGSSGGGSGGHATFDSSTFTLSSGAGSSFNTGGGGQHIVSTSDPEHTVISGGNSGDGGGRTVCDISPDAGSFVCQKTGKP